MSANLSRFFICFLFCIATNPVTANLFQHYPELWIGDTAMFIYHAETNTLQLNAPEDTESTAIWHPSGTMEDAVWETGFLMDFNPSSANYLQIFLAVDDTTNFQNGFYLVAGTSDDNISLWKRENGKDQLLIQGAEDRLDMTTAIARVKATRKRGGRWELKSDVGNGWQTEGNFTDSFGFSPLYAGYGCHFTKSRRNKFFFDPIEISGETYRDTVPPHITCFEVKNGHTLKTNFSEAIDTIHSTPLISFTDHYNPGINKIAYDTTLTQATIHLTTPLPDADQGKMVIGGWCDPSNACMKDTIFNISYLSPQVLKTEATSYRSIEISLNLPVDITLFSPDYFALNEPPLQTSEIRQLKDGTIEILLNNKIPDAREIELTLKNLLLPNGDTIPQGPYPIYYHEAHFADLVFSEIMHDPSPAALLPETEYIELFNRSNLPVNLKGMSIKINERILTLPEYLLFPADYVVLPAIETDFPNNAVPKRWVPLNNSGGTMVLLNPSAEVVTAFRYPETLEGETYKTQGGWSMESIDTNNLSGSLSNWAYCNNEKGGTPGHENAVTNSNPDTSNPLLADSWLKNDSVLILDFGETLNTSAIDMQHFTLSGTNTIQNIKTDSLFRDLVMVTFENKLAPNEVNTLSIPSELTDLAGNSYAGKIHLQFGLPGNMNAPNLLISEILFDPPANGYDYVEIYNPSAQIFALDSLCISRGSESGEPEELILLSDRCKWFLPGQYLCLSGSANWVKEWFGQSANENILNLNNFPNFTNEGGSVFITLKNGKVIDRMDYSPELHFELLSNTKGISLERTSFSMSTNAPGTWHSAASTAGYGTPGVRNSQLLNTKVEPSKELFSLSPDILTPNMDGVDDNLIISWQLGKPGHKGTFVIYDAEGFQVRELINNQSLDTSGHILWDGITDDHQRAVPGIYIVWGQIHDKDGHVKRHKATCVVGIRQ